MRRGARILLPDGDTHLSIDEFVYALATGVSPGHVGYCEECSEILVQARLRMDMYADPPRPEPGPDCLADLSLAELATGARHEEEWLDHLSECGLCCQRLKMAIADLTSDLTPEELTSIDQLSTASPIWQSQFVDQMIGGRTRRRGLSRLIWAGVLAAGMVFGVLGWWFLKGSRSGTGQLLAAAYTEMRPFEYRIPDQGYRRPRIVRGTGPSPLGKPATLLHAETEIAGKLQRFPGDHEWLRWRGVAELLELSPDAAVESLSKARTSDPEDDDAAGALAVAYALRAEGENRVSDYAFALELLNGLAKRHPSDARVRFNRAIVFERLRLNEDAIREWNQYLALDGGSDWAKEARQRLKDLMDHKAAREELRRKMREGPKQFLARTTVPWQAEGYIDQTAIEWMAQVQNEPAAREALSSLGSAMWTEHGDAWLKDAAKELGSSNSGVALLEIVNANLRGDANHALELVNQSSREFQQKGQPALRLRADFDRVYALHRALKAADCVAASGNVEEEAKRLSYQWIAIQAHLERAACIGFEGNKGDAIEKIQEAKDMAEKTGLSGLALRARGMLASEQILAGDPWTCWTDSVLGLDQYWQSGYPPNRAHQLYFNLADAAEQLDLPATAFLLSRAAMEQFALTDNRPTEALGDARAGAMAVKAGYTDEAASLFRRAASISAALSLSSTSVSYNLAADVAKAQAEADRGDLVGAKLLLRTMEVERKSLPTGQEVLPIGYPRELVSGEVALRSSDYTGAEEHLKKAIAFADLQIRSLHTQAERLLVLEETSRAPRLLMEAMLMSGRNPADALNVWLRFRSSPDESAETKVSPVSGKMGRLVYAALNGRIAAWDLSGDKVKFLWLKPSDKDVAERADRLLNLISDPDQDPAPIHGLARSLYSDLVAPFGFEPSNYRVLKILSDSGTARVPFGLLIGKNGKYLGEEVPTVLAHRIGGDVLGERFSSSSRALILANPSAGAMLAGPRNFLSDVNREGRSVAEFFTRPEILLGADATLSRLQPEASKAEIVHFAGHGFSNNGNGGLVLADGLLTSRQILSGSWTPCRLVVLSACLTATGELRGPANPGSLVRALQISGVPAVVAALWSVDSAATRQYMDAFYRSLVGGETVASAVRAAQGALRSRPEFRHPYYWGAFQAFE